MKTKTKIRFILSSFLVLLVLSGITAFPLRTEIEFLVGHKSSFPLLLQNWIDQVYLVITSTPDIMLYGTDWLAFAHIVIAMFFIPVYFDPVRYKQNVITGMVACAGVFPLAFICGPLRNIPFFHQLIDCAFGVGGIVLLFIILKEIRKIEKERAFGY